MENKNTTETNVETIVPPAVSATDDAEAKVAALEKEKAALMSSISDQANYKIAYLKEKKKNENLDEDPDDKMRKIATEVIASSRLAEIAEEQDAIIQKALKENKELKLASLNKTDIPASTTTHSEGQKVVDTLVTPEQMLAFKAKGWTDKDIERYKKNYIKYGGR